ncbi:MAG: PAS domain S-box protein, partial [Longimicrobiales bacterium]
MQRAHADLERRVEERTAELARTNEALQAEIAERLRTEEALARSEEHFRLLIEKSSDIATILDADGITRYQSGSIERVLGYTADELVGHDAFEYVHEDDRAEAAASFARLFVEPGATNKVELRFRHRDGSWRWLEGVGRALRYDDPGAGVIVNSRDVTERKEVESALRRSEEQFRSLIENGSDVIGVVDPSGQVLYTSPSTERVLGRQPDEIIGRSAFEFIHPDDVEPTKAVFARVIESPGGAMPAEFRMLHQDGTWRLLEAITKPLVHDGVVDGMVVNARDMTERKRAEDALQRAKGEAEESREIAERANRAKSEFLSRMSHELRTPMNSILGFAQVLWRKELPHDQRKAVDHILKAGRHLLNLINEVLDISRIEANRQQLSLEPVRVMAVVQETLNLIRPLAAQRGVVIEEPVALSEEWHVESDRQRLAQVLLNLLSNAAKYNRPDGTIGVDGEVVEGRVRIHVRDTGPGVPEEKLEQLFVPF